MKEFVLGYKSLDDKKLTLFKNESDADYNCEEWCMVKARDIKQARKDYEKTFLKWKEGVK